MLRQVVFVVLPGTQLLDLAGPADVFVAANLTLVAEAEVEAMTPDQIDVLSGEDMIFGDGGADRLFGAFDVDLIEGGAGDDRRPLRAPDDEGAGRDRGQDARVGHVRVDAG